jgi:choline dehydrogenase
LGLLCEFRWHPQRDITDEQVNHYPTEAQNAKDPKYLYELPDGALVEGPNPPANSTGKGFLYPRSAAIGGCVNHNALIMMRPLDEDWAQIESVTGDSSWNPAQMSTYFSKFEDCQYCSPGAAGHGFDGWLPTNRVDESVFLGDNQVVNMLEVCVLSSQSDIAVLMVSRLRPQSRHKKSVLQEA